MHGGSVAAKSDGPGRGACFEVRLPLASAQTPAPAVAAPAADAAIAPRRVLVVDDNRDAAETLALLLKLGGHEVRALCDPLLALATLEAFRPQIAFLDVGMPKLNGLDLAGKIRASEAGSDVLLVALTGWGQDDDRRRSQEAGFDYHLVKPADPLDIETICREGVRRAGA
jgi:CheY-like chemotaxis protein